MAAIWLALGLTIAAPQMIRAQDVTLRSPDGSIALDGTLLGFDGEFYRLVTDFGELTVDASGVACAGPACPSLTGFVARVAFVGAESMGRVLLPALVESFARREGLVAERREPDARTIVYDLRAAETLQRIGEFEFRATQTDEGFADLLAGEADIVMARREIRPDERLRAEEVGLGDLTEANRSLVIALDAALPIVAPQNPVRRIALTDLEGVLAGRIDNWQALGGPDAPITLHLPASGSGLWQRLAARLLPASLAPRAPRAEILRHATGEALARAVNADPFGLGMTGYAETGLARALDLTGPCGFVLRATERSVKTEDYPLTAPLFLYFPARRLPSLVRGFLAYAQSTTAQPVVRRAGFIDQAGEETDLAADGERLANAIAAADGSEGLGELQRLVATLRARQRLSISFRFEPGQARLDAQSRSNIGQLAAGIAQGRFDARDILLVGFSDGVGGASANLLIARERADAVRQALLDALATQKPGPVEIATDAFGEALPLACDDTEWGREINRRVEVWLR